MPYCKIFVSTFFLLATTSMSVAQKPLKIYISADMEGVAGAVTEQQLGPAGFEYQRFREFMTAEVNASIAAAREAGATEIVVSDSHGNGQNLLIEKLPEDVKVIRSWPRALGMMEGIDSSFDGAIYIGYHSSTHNPEGVRAHTKSSAKLTDIKINGQSVSEGIFNAMIAGHFDVPIIMVSGDDIAVKENRDAIGPIEGAVVKEAISFHSAKTLTPQAAYKLIAEKTKSAIQNIEKYKPLKTKTPVTVDISFKHYRAAEMLAFMPGATRVDSHTVRYIAKDMIEASRYTTFVLGYDSNLSP